MVPCSDASEMKYLFLQQLVPQLMAFAVIPLEELPEESFIQWPPAFLGQSVSRDVWVEGLKTWPLTRSACPKGRPSSEPGRGQLRPAL